MHARIIDEDRQWQVLPNTRQSWEGQVGMFTSYTVYPLGAPGVCRVCVSRHQVLSKVAIVVTARSQRC
jgi:hypothetical protein